MAYKDLRGWLDEADKMGELNTIEGAHWDKEIGAICEMLGERPNPSALLFDKVPGYPDGFRVLGNPFLTNRRTGLTLGVPGELPSLEMLDAWRKRMKAYKPVPPVEVKDAPVKENVLTGKDVDLFKLPTPIWHELDGGRYLGTGCAIITRDAEGWVNLGTYRCRVFDKDLISVGVNPGKHGAMMMDECHARGEAFPLAIVCGMDPAIFAAACQPISDLGDSEYDLAGYIKGEPIGVTKGEYTGLPLPAGAEIVLEGEIPPPPHLEYRHDGPFGEWRRIYNSAPHPIMKVKSILHRNDPIILGVPTFKLPIPFPFTIPIMAGEIWNVLDSAGIPGVTGVWFSMGYVWASLMVIKIKQQYPGHSRQTALAALSCRASTIGGQYVVVVDDDIDITSELEVMWAVVNRAKAEGFHFIKGLRTMAGSPMIPRESLKKGIMAGDRVIIDACWPYEHLKEASVTSRYSPGYQAEIMKKFKSLF